MYIFNAYVIPNLESADLPGNPNVVLVSLGKLLSEEKGK